MTASTEKYKWVEVTDELEHTGVCLPTSALGEQTIHHGRVILTLYVTPMGFYRLIPGQPVRDGEYRVTLDYNSSRAGGISAVFHKLSCVEWVDVTRECKVDLKASQHTSGHYGIITHKGTQVALLGIDGVKLCANMGDKYKLEKSKNARVSFNVFKKRTN